MLCYHLGQCQCLLGCSSSWLTNNPRFSNISLPLYSKFLNPIEGFFFGMAVEGQWLRPLHPCSPPSGHGGGLIRYYSWGLPGLDNAYMGFLPPLPCLYCLWWWWESMAWTRQETGYWSRINVIFSFCTKSFFSRLVYIGKYMEIISLYYIFFIRCIFLQYIYFFTRFLFILLQYIVELKFLKMYTFVVSLYCVHHVKRLFWWKTISAIIKMSMSLCICV